MNMDAIGDLSDDLLVRLPILVKLEIRSRSLHEFEERPQMREDVLHDEDAGELQLFRGEPVLVDYLHLFIYIVRVEHIDDRLRGNKVEHFVKPMGQVNWKFR